MFIGYVTSKSHFYQLIDENQKYLKKKKEKKKEFSIQRYHFKIDISINN